MKRLIIFTCLLLTAAGASLGPQWVSAVIDGRISAEIDKRMPPSLVGDGGKILMVRPDETAYAHVDGGGRPVGEVMMWPFATAPTGYLTCRTTTADTTEYLTSSYPALGALLEPIFPGSVAGRFRTPVVLFPKNSGGVGTLTVNPAQVGTHGHTAQPVAAHGHTASTSSSGIHGHSAGDVIGIDNPGTGGWNFLAIGATGENLTSNNGSHTHVLTVAPAGGHTPVVNNHTGTNQPENTNLHFCIKT